MKLVVDSNVVIASLLKDGISRALLMEAPAELLAPEHMLAEIRKHRSTIAKRANLTEAEFDLLFALVTDRISVQGVEVYKSRLDEACNRIGKKDLGDVPFLALALQAECGIWTYNPRHFEGADIQIWSTNEVANWNRSVSVA